MVSDLKYVQIGIVLYFCNDLKKNQLKAYKSYIKSKSPFKMKCKTWYFIYGNIT